MLYTTEMPDPLPQTGDIKGGSAATQCWSRVVSSYRPGADFCKPICKHTRRKRTILKGTGWDSESHKALTAKDPRD